MLPQLKSSLGVDDKIQLEMAAYDKPSEYCNRLENMTKKSGSTMISYCEFHLKMKWVQAFSTVFKV